MSDDLIKSVSSDMTVVGTPGQFDYQVTWNPDSPNNKHPDWWNERVQRHMQDHQDDPIPIPKDDPGMQAALYLSQRTLTWIYAQSPRLRLFSMTPRDIPGTLR